MHDRIRSKVDEIAEFLINYDTNLLSTIGVKYGRLGVSLFLFHYFKYSQNEKSLVKASEIIDLAIDSIINDGFAPQRARENIVDFGRFLEYVNHYSLVSIDTNSILHDLDGFLYGELSSLLDQGDIDVADGALCIAYYFLSRMRSNPEVRDYLEEFIFRMDHLAIKSEEGIRWKSALFEGDRIYLGLHGSAAVIMVLDKLMQQGIQPGLASHMMEQAASFIIKNRLINNKVLFPVIVNRPLERVVLEYAYGDLLPGLALFKSSIALKNPIFKTVAHEAFNNAALRINDDNIVQDAGLVHGITGTAFLFDEMYRLSSVNTYKDTADNCYRMALRGFHGDHPNAIAGYKAKYDIDIPGADVSFISGVAGIGLSFLSFLNPDIREFKEFLFL